MSFENKEINLDLPVDAYDAEGNPKASSVSEESSTEVSQTEEKKVVEKEESEEDEQRIPYSRFSTVRERAERAEREADEARALLKQALSRKDEEVTSDPYKEAFAKEVKSLYGDNDIAKNIIDIQLKHSEEIEKRAEQRAIEAIKRVQREETQAISQNESIIDEKLENLSETLGRALSPKEEEALLEIVDEYTPVGEDGNYVGEILPFDKAWEVYELRQLKQGQSSKKARSGALNASSSRSSGEPSATAEQDKNWSPLNWNSLNDRLRKITS